MSVREYVGARYVPLFADPIQWDNTNTYEPLTIVLYQGNSFTSKQYVPEGIEITNEEYWAETGNYNAQIEQYRREVLENENRITAVEDEIEEITIPINSLDELSTSNQAILMDTKTFPNGQAELTLGISNGKQQTVINPSVSTHGNSGGTRDLCACFTLLNSYLAHSSDIYYGNKYVPLRYISTEDDPSSTFVNPKFIKPREHRNENNQMACDCVTLTNLIANGILYGNSSYASSENEFLPAHAFFDIHDESVKAYFFASQEDEEGVVRENFPAGSIGRGRLAASSTARYLYDRGLLEFVNPDKNSGLNNLCPGDILFHAKNYPAGSTNTFMGITHTSVFCGGLDISNPDTLIVGESVRFNETGVGVRKLSRTITNNVNGPVVAKFSPNYTIGARLMNYNPTVDNQMYRCNARKFENYDFTTPYEWECGTINRYGARVVTFAMQEGYSTTLHVTLTNKIPGLEGGSWSDITGDVALIGVKTLIIPYGFDIKVESTTTRKVDIIQQVCLSDKQIITPIVPE